MFRGLWQSTPPVEPDPSRLPSVAEALSAPPSSLAELIVAIAPGAGYDASNAQAAALVRAALYSFAFSQQQPAHDGEQQYRLLPELLAGLNFAEAGTAESAQPDSRFSLESIQAKLHVGSSSTSSAGGEYAESRRGKPCGHVFKSGESVYRCRDCAVDATCVLCSRCFHGSNHDREQHDVTMATHTDVGAGCCDCGDPEAFKPGTNEQCRWHSLQTRPSASSQAGEALSQAQIAAALEQVRDRAVPVLENVLDFICAVLDDCTEEFDAPVNQAAVQTAHTRRQVSSLPLSAVKNSAQPAATDASGPWTVVLWNDEKHSFDEVIEIVRRATGLKRDEANRSAQAVDRYGREVVYRGRDASRATYIAKMIASIELAVTARTALDTFCEDVAGAFVEGLKDVTRASVAGEPGALAETVARVMLARQGTALSRFQRMLISDHCLWKTARKTLSELYVALLSINLDIKTELCVQFAEVYPRIAETYLLVDREPDLSIIYLGVQVFTVPSIASILVEQHDFLSKMIALLYAFFTEQTDLERRPRLAIPPDPNIRTIKPDSQPFRQRRYLQVFSDLNHLFQSPGAKRHVCTSQQTLERFTAFLSLFTGMNPTQRATTAHIEYESDVWVTAFNVTIQLAKLCRAYGEAYRHAQTIELVPALERLLIPMGAHRQHPWHALSFNGRSYDVVDFRPEAGVNSFHHPLAWLFAEMCKNVDALDASELRRVGWSSMSDLAMSPQGKMLFQVAMERPLRVIALVAQIRSSLWVRNGFSMRAQQLHYREYSLRETTFDQDVYFLQLSLVILDPSVVFLSIMDRFNLLEWLAGHEHSVYDDAQAFSMSEELLYFFILLLAERTNAAGLSPLECIRREVIHMLCLGPCSYSDLTKRMSEQYSDDPALDRVLATVADFRPPRGVSDQGKYTLRPQFYAEVDPYFSRYNRNQREEAEESACKELKKQSGNDSVVLPPRPLEITKGPFVKLASVLGDDVLHQTLFFAILNGKGRGEDFSETLVDEAVYLCMLALQEEPLKFSRFALERELVAKPAASTLVELLAKVEDDSRFKPVHHKIAWCFDRLREQVGPKVDEFRQAKLADEAVRAAEAKKAAAKARQAAIMAQFAQQQQSFLDTVDDDVSDNDVEIEGAPAAEAPSLGTCILCQEKLDDTEPFASLAAIQPSNLVRKWRDGDESQVFMEALLSTPLSLDDDARGPRWERIRKMRENVDPDVGDGMAVFSPALKSHTGLHASSCGHMMHLSCFETYYMSVSQRHQQQATRRHPEDLERNEFVCPLCKSLGNVLLPISLASESDCASTVLDARSLGEWVADVQSSLVKDDSDMVTPQDWTDEMRALCEELHSDSSALGSARACCWEAEGHWIEYLDSESAAVTETERDMGTRFFDTVAPLSQELQGSVYLPTRLAAYTLQSIEVSSRGLDQRHNGGAPLAVSSGTVRMLRGLLQNLSTVARAKSPRALEVLAYTSLRRVSHELFAPDMAGVSPPSDAHHLEDSSLLPLAILIELAVANRSIFRHAVALLFYTEVARAVHVRYNMPHPPIGFTHSNTNAAARVHTDESATLLQAFAALDEALQLSRLNEHHWSQDYLPDIVYSFTLPFLRAAAILFHVACDAPALPPSTDACEMSRLLEYLGVPGPVALLQGRGKDSSVDVLWRHLVTPQIVWHLPTLDDSPDAIYGRTNQAWRQPQELMPEITYPGIYELVSLPRRLDTLIALGQSTRCKHCGDVPEQPALCLICGEMVCFQSFCCMRRSHLYPSEREFGECNLHMWECGGRGGNFGVFFLIKRNYILYLCHGRGTFEASPYLDTHGEVDAVGRARRSQFPQTLHEGRYDEVRKQVMQQTVPSVIARKLDAVIDSGGWTTM